MAKRYRTGLKLVGFFLLLAFVLLLSYIKYQKEIENTSPLVLVKNGLSINYLNGNKIVLKGENKTYTFSITNNTEGELQYYVSLEDMKTNEKSLTYDLTEQNNKMKILQSEVTKENNTLASLVKINPSETHFYTLTLYGKENAQLTAKLDVNLETGNEEYFASTILKNNEPKKETLTNVGVDIATTNEGLIEATDDYGTFYYFRGNIENNYVQYANLLWRIVRINSDGSVRLVLNDDIGTTSILYETNTETLEEKLDFLKSPLEKVLSTWYDENLKDFDGYLISNKYCVDDSISLTEGARNYYAGNQRLLKDFNVSNSCSGKEYTSRYGILSADEVVLAGATTTADNTSYYLYVPEKVVSYWTLTPNYSEEKDVTFFEVTTTGKVISENTGTVYKGVRPVINLIKKTQVTGEGTLTSPYILK